MSLEINARLSSLLVELASSDKRYATAAKGIMQSVSDAREPIQLPQSVVDILGSAGVPDLSPYTQADLLLLMDAMAKTIQFAQSAPDTTPVDDGSYVKYRAEYREQYNELTNEQLGSVFTRDKFEGLKPLRAYALAMTLSDIAADRRLQVPALWQSVIDNYTKLGE